MVSPNCEQPVLLTFLFIQMICLPKPAKQAHIIHGNPERGTECSCITTEGINNQTNGRHSLVFFTWTFINVI